jgi:hypothetical protein
MVVITIGDNSTNNRNDVKYEKRGNSIYSSKLDENSEIIRNMKICSLVTDDIEPKRERIEFLNSSKPLDRKNFVSVSKNPFASLSTCALSKSDLQQRREQECRLREQKKFEADIESAKRRKQQFRESDITRYNKMAKEKELLELQIKLWDRMPDSMQQVYPLNSMLKRACYLDKMI